MSAARPIIPGTTYFITRRTSERRYFLRPSERLNRIFAYLVAVIAERTGVQLHSLCVMSNHWHCVATDVEGKLPAFLKDLHGLLARHLNRDLGRWENFWSTSQTSLVRPAGDDAVLDRVVYTMANPTKAGLVAHGRDWPGLRRAWPAAARALERPFGFFRDGGPLPKTATLTLVRPPGFEDQTDDELAARIAAEIQAREQQHRDELRAAERSFRGRRAVRRTSPFGSPKTPVPRRTSSPRVSGKDAARRRALLAELKAFAARYKPALRAFIAGDRDALFPPGTYLMRVVHAVRVAPS